MLILERLVEHVFDRGASPDDDKRVSSIAFASRSTWIDMTYFSVAPD